MALRDGAGQGWTPADAPGQLGRVAVVTGANAGLGFETAKTLAERGAAVVLACRDLDKARAAATRTAASTTGRPAGCSSRAIPSASSRAPGHTTPRPSACCGSGPRR